ncbi:MAG: hypothetical protein L3J02_02470, partial [Henriciella sp.]|nr:hypothetical protein [Henriciella sp.]
MYRTAILVDGGFFLKRYTHICRGNDPFDAKLAANVLYDLASKHLSRPVRNGQVTTYERDCDLYRLFVYDSPQLEKRIHTPIDKRARNLATTPEAKFR